MDPLDFLGSEQLLRFFRRNKTLMSCMENPHTFLSQLRDHDLIPEDRYKRVSNMKSKEKLKKGVYDVLDWLETERPQHIHVFWRCVFEETIRNQYPTLRLLRSGLVDGCCHFHARAAEEEEEETSDGGRKVSGEEERNADSAKKKTTNKKRRVRSGSAPDDEEQPGPSSQLTPGQQKKSRRLRFTSPLKKGGEGDIWTWAIFQHQLPVTCGDLQGSLSKARLAKGEKCVLFQKQWLTPDGFARRSGNRSSEDWTLSIRCNGVALAKLIQDGHLQHEAGAKVNKSPFPSDRVATVNEDEEGEGEDEEGEGEDEEGEGRAAQAPSRGTEGSPGDAGAEPTERQQEVGGGGAGTSPVLAVTCGSLTGTLHRKRFASGTCGRSIRTGTSWATPAEFAAEASCQTDVSWRTDIKCEDAPLGDLVAQDVLVMHDPTCRCRLCRPDPQELENQKNDDECFVCRSDDGPELVVCDYCPRAFHQTCHLPHVRDKILRDSDPWMCTFCVFRTNQPCRYGDELEMRAVLSQQISQHMLECQYLLLFLCNADEEQTFALNPDLYVQNYSAVIHNPMWFDEVANKLQNSSYRTVGEFVSDVRLIFANCAKYNRRNPEFLETGRRLKRLFEEEFKKALGVREAAPAAPPPPPPSLSWRRRRRGFDPTAFD